jgi:outer membrane beta-barrel protein
LLKCRAKTCILAAKTPVFSWLAVATLIFSAIETPQAVAQETRFDNYEIRVIRPRYFSKRSKFELGVTGSVITNQTFIYTYLLSGALTYHFTDIFGLELSGTYGKSFPKEDMTTLRTDDFKIRTQILRTKYMMEGALLYTPIYGKYQLSTGRLIYFDTFLAAGAGSTGVEYLYDHCEATKKDESGRDVPTDVPAPTVMSYPTFVIGGGQRYFLNKRDGLRWDVKLHHFSYNEKDGGCPIENLDSELQQDNVTFQFGVSRFL